MAYQALYRKLRPKKFADVFGQDNIVKTLQNQIISDKIAHAYLFCGTRGTGKTSLAKIMAAAVNCENIVDAEPCGHCKSCTSLIEDTNMDVLELDAASRNGVDDMRDLLDRVAYPPQIGKYKVYIIDEVHMLSTAAFNALLKTLEEPPSHVIFILATTEQQKIPATILSRCQKFDLSRVSSKLILSKMKDALDDIGIKYDNSALMQVAIAAEGSVRDAWSILDICIGSLNKGDLLSCDIVENMLGTSTQDFILDMSEYILSQNQLEIMKSIETLMQNGKEAQVFIKQLSKLFRDMLVATLSKENIDETISDEEYAKLKKLGKSTSTNRIISIIDLLMKAEAEIRFASSTRILLENVLLKASMPIIDSSFENITEDLVNIISNKISSVEAKQETLSNKINDMPISNTSILQSEPDESKPIEKIKPDASVHEIWKIAKSNISNNSIKGLIGNQTLHKDNKGYFILFNKKDEYLISILNSQNAIELIQKALEDTTGKSINFDIRVSENNNVQSFADAELELRRTLPDDILEVQD